MHRSWTAGLALLVALLPGCTTARQTDPQRTATEQLLISSAADRAARATPHGQPIELANDPQRSPH